MRRAQTALPSTIVEATQVQDPKFVELKQTYLNGVRLIERLHRQFLEVIDAELDRRRIDDINNVQSLILFNIGRDEATIGELITRGYYLGSNVSYNVRKLVESDYLVQERSVHDRRSSRVRLSRKGMELFQHFEVMFDHQVEAFDAQGSIEDLKSAMTVLRGLSEFWGGLASFGARGQL